MSNVFIPGGEVQKLSVDSDGSSVSLNGIGDVLRIISLNESLPSHWCAGVGSQTPAETDFAVFAGPAQFLFIGFAANTIGVKMPAGGNSGTVYVQRGSVR
jgi:hypothetical protein